MSALSGSLRKASKYPGNMLQRLKRQCIQHPKTFARKLAKYKEEYTSGAYVFPPNVREVLAKRTGMATLDHFIFFIVYKEFYKYMLWSFYMMILRQLPPGTHLKHEITEFKKQYGLCDG